MAERQCGSCVLCCKLPPIDESPLLGEGAFVKPANTWCKSCTIGVGCNVYAARPQSCVAYECVWLSNPELVPEELRPDKSKVIIEPSVSGGNLVLRVDPTNKRAWAKFPFSVWVTAILKRDIPIVVFDGTSSLLLKPSKRYVSEHIGREIAVDHVKRTVEFPDAVSRSYTLEDLAKGRVA